MVPLNGTDQRDLGYGNNLLSLSQKNRKKKKIVYNWSDVKLIPKPFSVIQNCVKLLKKSESKCSKNHLGFLSANVATRKQFYSSQVQLQLQCEVGGQFT